MDREIDFDPETKKMIEELTSYLTVEGSEMKTREELIIYCIEFTHQHIFEGTR